MLARNKTILGAAFIVAVVSLFLAPSLGEATPVGEVTFTSSLDNATLSVDAGQVQVDDLTLWRYDYTLTNLGPGTITSMSFGFGSSVAGENALHNIAPHSWENMPGFVWLTSSSLQVLNTNLAAGGAPVDFTIYYESFVAEQNVSVAGSPAINATGVYSLPNNNAVPEPGTLLLLGAGLITAGILRRRIGKS